MTAELPRGSAKQGLGFSRLHKDLECVIGRNKWAGPPNEAKSGPSDLCKE